MKKDRAKLHDEREQAGRPDEDRASRERNAGLAIALLALVVVGLLLAVAMGSAGALRP